MRKQRIAALALAGAVSLAMAAPVGAYPGGTPSYQTDVAPFCAACHSSINEAALEGAGERAGKETAERKHLALIAAGERDYAKLSEADRATLAEHIRAIDANSKIELEFPPSVEKGATFQVKVTLQGGAGPAVGVALVDRPHRWFAKPAPSVGWTILGAPTVIGDNGQPQKDWIGKRPEKLGHGLSFVNVTGIESDAAAGTWAKAKVIYTLRAPDKPGEYPLTGAFFYGTEKASPLGFETGPLGQKRVRGGYTGGSGRVRFTEEFVITVK